MIDKETQRERKLEPIAFFYLLLGVVSGTVAVFIFAGESAFSYVRETEHKSWQWPAAIAAAFITGFIYNRLAWLLPKIFPRFHKILLEIWRLERDIGD